VVGRSVGGNIAIEFASRYPEIPASIVLIDSVILPHQSFLDALQPLVEALKGSHYQAAWQQALLSMCLPAG
jgi:pimeloyl-ACP methyl ester carboxylesterase